MKLHALLTLGLVGLLATTSLANQEQLAASIKEARAEATRAAEQLKITLESVTALTKQKEGDLRPAYNTFAAQVPKTEEAAKWTRARVQWMESDGLKYFGTWQNTVNAINNESLRKKAQKRLDAARKNYDRVGVELKKAAEKFNPFLSDLADINKALANDVTAGGVKAIKGVVSDANWHYKGVNSAIAGALKEMDRMEKELSTEAK